MSTRRLPEFLTWKEGDMWICAWQRFDLVTQGKTEKQAGRTMIQVIAAHALAALSCGTIKTIGAPKPPGAELRRWRAAHRRTHG